MSLSNTLAIDTDATPADVRRVLLATGRFFALGDYNDRKCVGAEGVVIDIYAPPFEINSLLQAGIVASVELSFTNTDKRLLDAWLLNTLHAVIALLHAYPGDALLLHCTDTPALLRKAGRIVLDEREDLWDSIEPGILSLIKLPYEFGVIPVS